MNFKQGLERFEAYANNINQFDALKAKKGVFYFEDFVSNEEGTLRFLRFFDIDPGAPTLYFCRNDRSVAWLVSRPSRTVVERERPQLKRKRTHCDPAHVKARARRKLRALSRPLFAKLTKRGTTCNLSAPRFHYYYEVGLSSSRG